MLSQQLVCSGIPLPFSAAWINAHWPQAAAFLRLLLQSKTIGGYTFLDTATVYLALVLHAAAIPYPAQLDLY
ncbi:hypothetical protein D3C81_1297210 [compost metagenome]